MEGFSVFSAILMSIALGFIIGFPAGENSGARTTIIKMQQEIVAHKCGMFEIKEGQTVFIWSE